MKIYEIQFCTKDLRKLFCGAPSIWKDIFGTNKQSVFVCADNRDGVEKLIAAAEDEVNMSFGDEGTDYTITKIGKRFTKVANEDDDWI